MSSKMMVCGHTANAKQHTPTGQIDCCVICSETRVAESPNLEGRTSMCSYCGKKTESKLELPFFEYRPTSKFDIHYCGCGGWD